MKKYEAVFIFVPNLDDEKKESITKRLKGIIEEDGTVTNVDEWGNRKLAYEIDDYQEGYYIIVNFETTSDTIKELDRVAKISDSILRHMIIRDDE
jgi:small subunit ribosomal protein S6